ncbi:hypothetical protein HF313_12800 [Massilia atriviolacea]|uniref:Tat pathway signal sequence domain protein n=1 Tax=Massilia atriviolacea TaxID=2495579 RepID=A0A430HQ30_9BURK|nr:hypothetical protein [Massilia atriviolacea]RSZ59625.1 hypothetical protein EJB06_05350 [Massilia atriviolacea]
MKTTHLLARAIACGLSLSLALPALAQLHIVKPGKDVTPIDAMGVRLNMLNTVIDRNNAHDIEIIGFFISNSNGPGQSVPFEIGYDYQPVLTLQSGADCAISTVRIFRRGATVRVVHAQRKGAWSDKKRAKVTVFELEKSTEFAPGTPGLYFKSLKTGDTKGSYCDVNDALDQETSLYK